MVGDKDPYFYSPAVIYLKKEELIRLRDNLTEYELDLVKRQVGYLTNEQLDEVLLRLEKEKSKNAHIRFRHI